MDASSIRAARIRNQRRELLSKRRELLSYRPNETYVDLVDVELMTNDKLKDSTSTVDNLIAQGTAILSSIRGQGADLNEMKRKAFHIGQSLGLSTKTLRTIENVLEEDWILFVCCCIFSLFFMYWFYRFWKG
uniref:Uncharacterized protein n=1 Tax=Ditylenchus dipsaci TaxID=166011 RepID=A0A915CUU9_9BILA